ncbi:hypothetical protein Trydic_g17321 [Trypoxylus dichotomus]
MFAFETDTPLEFEACAAVHQPQFVEPRSEYDEDYEHEDCIPREARIIIDTEYKRRAVNYWRNSKSKRRSMESVQHRLKKAAASSNLVLLNNLVKLCNTFSLYEDWRASGFIGKRVLADVPGLAEVKWRLATFAEPSPVPCFGLPRNFLAARLGGRLVLSPMSNSAAIQRSAQNWHGLGESDCLIKTKHCDGPCGC